jgi:hypothetical protein
MHQIIIGYIGRDSGGDAQRFHARNRDQRDVAFKHVLLPV